MSTHETAVENVEPVSDLAYRYIKARVSGGGFPEFPMEEMARIREFVESRFTDDEFHIVHAYRSVEREFTSGHRCSVCGRTVAQSKAIGYDCVREC